MSKNSESAADPPKKMARVAPFKCTSASTVLCAHLPRATGNKTAWRSHGCLFRGSQLACCSLSWASEGRGRLVLARRQGMGGSECKRVCPAVAEREKRRQQFLSNFRVFLCGSLKDGIHDEADFACWLLKNTQTNNNNSPIPYERRMGLWWPVGEHSKQLGKKGPYR